MNLGARKYQLVLVGKLLPLFFGLMILFQTLEQYMPDGDPDIMVLEDIETDGSSEESLEDLHYVLDQAMFKIENHSDKLTLEGVFFYQDLKVISPSIPIPEIPPIV